MTHKKSGRPKVADPKTHRYNFLLNDKQEIRFRKMLEEADCTKNISRFILSRLFGWELKVDKIDTSKAQFIARLNDFYWQFSKLGNNYNQVVRQVHSRYSDRAILTQLDILTGYTRQLKALSLRIEALAKQMREEWSQE